MKILVLCTGNSCRSQMAEGFLNRYLPDAEIRSAGTKPSDKIHPRAVEAMKEIGIDISGGSPEYVDKYLDYEWDYVITVCGGAKEACPAFIGKVKERLHIGFDDPAEAEGSDEHVMSEFRRIRDEIKVAFSEFVMKNFGETSR